jgi:hypothetical protein
MTVRFLDYQGFLVKSPIHKDWHNLRSRKTLPLV